MRIASIMVDTNYWHDDNQQGFHWHWKNEKSFSSEGIKNVYLIVREFWVNQEKPSENIFYMAKYKNMFLHSFVKINFTLWKGQSLLNIFT